MGRHWVGAGRERGEKKKKSCNADSRDRTSDLQIFSLTLSQLSYTGDCCADGWDAVTRVGRMEKKKKITKGAMRELNPRPLLP